MKKFFTILATMLVLVSIRVNGQNRDDSWLMYDDGTFAYNIGLLSGVPIYWANMFTPAQLAEYDGYSLTKIKMWDHTPYSGYMLIYQDNSETGPLDLVYTQQYTVTGTNDWCEIELTTPVTIDITKNLWITFNNTDGENTIPASNDSGDPNSRWISVDGREWDDASTVGMPPFTWMIRGYITNDGGVSVAELGSNEALIYPNPASDLLHISANNILNVSVFDLIGRMIFQNNVSVDETTIDLNEYQSGIYMVRVQTESGVIVKKINVIK